jgi:hypothetical protein
MMLAELAVMFHMLTAILRMHLSYSSFLCL